MERLQRAIPVLASLHMDKTVQCYQQKMGFDKIGRKDADYAVKARDQVALHFWKCNAKINCFMMMKEMEGLYEEPEKTGVVRPKEPLKEQPWDILEFSVRDAGETTIKFGKNIVQCS